MPRILDRPTGVEDKEEENGGSFFSFMVNEREKSRKKTNVENQSCPTRTMIIIPRKMISETCGRSQQWGLFCESNLTHHANNLDHAKCV